MVILEHSGFQLHIHNACHDLVLPTLISDVKDAVFVPQLIQFT